jgi:hypothetical protein
VSSVVPYAVPFFIQLLTVPDGKMKLDKGSILKMEKRFKRKIQ